MSDWIAPDWFAMHGYAAYVWSAYAVFAIVIIADALGPILRRRRTLAALRGRLQREAARAARGTPKSETAA
jgi:heme exporter protein D